MPQFDNVVVIGTYNRAHLLLRSLFHYQASKRNGSLALVIIDDGSTDYTEELCRKFANPDLPIFYFKLTDKELGTWRDSAAFINMGISFAIHALGTRVVLPTHPEICVGETTISDIVDYVKEKPDSFGLAKGYYLTPEQQDGFKFDHWGCGDSKTYIESMLTHEWIVNLFNHYSIQHFIQQTPDFYNYGDQTHAYHHSQVEKAKTWDSWIFCGASRETWLKFGGFSESNAWGTIDVTFHHRRYHGDFATWTPESRESMVVHQCHDEGLPTDTPRNMELCMKTAAELDATPCQPELLNPERWKA